MNIKEAVNIFLQTPWDNKLQLLVYPIFLIWRMPIAWAKSLWKARVLLNGQWHRYMGFHPQNAINTLFYRTQWINLDRYGRKGISPTLGLGQFPLKKLFHLSLLSSYVYANAGAVTTLLGTLFWVFSHLIWVDSTNPLNVILVVVILLFSTTAYAMSFARQNYQILGWMWLPLALYSVSSEQWMLASFVWFVAGVFGITPIFFAIPIMITMSFISESWFPVFVLTPALILTSSRFLPNIFAGGLSSDLINIAKVIGMTNRKVRYQRQMHRLRFVILYFLCLYVFSSFVYWWISGSVPVLLFAGAILLFINERFFRVADEQQLYLLNSTLWAYELIKTPSDFLLLIIYWFALNPLPLTLTLQNISKDFQLSKILINAPFDNEIILNDMRKFLSPVKSHETIYFAYNDPKNIYNNIFDGYKVIYEVPLCVAADRGIHLFPDTYAVMETNFEGAPQCWGRSIDEVVSNCKRWKASYAIIYQETCTEIDRRWLDEFNCVSEFDWSDSTTLLRGADLWKRGNPVPKWFLLKRKNLEATKSP